MQGGKNIINIINIINTPPVLFWDSYGGGYKDRNRGFQSLALQKSKKYCRIQTGGLGPLTGGFLCERGVGCAAEGYRK